MKKTIEITVYHAPDGKQTCRNIDGSCDFLRVSNFGATRYCAYTNRDVFYDLGNNHLIVSKGCPLK